VAEHDMLHERRERAPRATTVYGLAALVGPHVCNLWTWQSRQHLS
jgi:hypothetical protein